MKPILFVAKYIWNCLKSIAAIIWNIGLELIKRVFLFIYHLVQGLIFLGLGLYLGTNLLFSNPKKWPKWFGKCLVASLIWLGRLLGKTMDMVFVGEIMDLIFQILKPNSRMLSKAELTEAKKVFGESLKYWQIRVDEFSLIAKLGAWFAASKNMGVTTFHTINFTRKLDSQAGNRDMEWLVHELAHISQMEHVGIQYLGEALIAQNTGGYSYGGVESLKDKTLHDFNREQQAEIAADFYHRVLYGITPGDNFLPLIAEFRNQNKLWIT